MSFYMPTKGFPLYFVRGEWVMLDIDLERWLWAGTEVVSVAAKRNRRLLTPEFTFQLTDTEWDEIRSLKEIRWDGRRALPQAYTEHGVVILCVVLNHTNVLEVIQPFINARKATDITRELVSITGELSAKVIEHESILESIKAELHQVREAPTATSTPDTDRKKTHRPGTSNIVRDNYWKQTILTYAEAALIAGVSVGTITGWVSQKRNPLPRCATRGPYRIDHVELLKFIGRS